LYLRLTARIVNVKPPCTDFYRAAIASIDRAANAHSGQTLTFAAEAAASPHAEAPLSYGLAGVSIDQDNRVPAG